MMDWTTCISAQTSPYRNQYMVYIYVKMHLHTIFILYQSVRTDTKEQCSLTSGSGATVLVPVGAPACGLSAADIVY